METEPLTPFFPAPNSPSTPPSPVKDSISPSYPNPLAIVPFVMATTSPPGCQSSNPLPSAPQTAEETSATVSSPLLLQHAGHKTPEKALNHITSPVALTTVFQEPIVTLPPRFISPSDRRNPRSAKKKLFPIESPTAASTTSIPVKDTGNTAHPRRSNRNPKPNNSFRGFEVGLKRKGRIPTPGPSKKSLQSAIKEAGLNRSLLSEAPLTLEEQRALKSYCGLLPRQENSSSSLTNTSDIQGVSSGPV